MACFAVFSIMNIKCPYCGCNYEITGHLLKTPIGSEKLGYGWWLRCYKCQKKWWLKHSTVEKQMNSPLMADKESKINKISKLGLRNKEIKKKKTNIRKIIKYGILLIIISTIGISIVNRNSFYEYILLKAKRLTGSVANNLVLNNVKYFIDKTSIDGNMKITVEGQITNKGNSVTKVNELRASVFDSSGKKIKSWNFASKDSFVVAGDTIEFSTRETLPKQMGDVKVDISVF